VTKILYYSSKEVTMLVWYCQFQCWDTHYHKRNCCHVGYAMAMWSETLRTSCDFTE